VLPCWFEIEHELASFAAQRIADTKTAGLSGGETIAACASDRVSLPKLDAIDARRRVFLKLISANVSTTIPNTRIVYLVRWRSATISDAFTQFITQLSEFIISFFLLFFDLISLFFFL
jgi:hypothetical protein